MDENYFLGWSLDMTSICLEYKTRIVKAESMMEKKSFFHDVAYAIIGNYWLANNIIYIIDRLVSYEKIFQP